MTRPDLAILSRRNLLRLGAAGVLAGVFGGCTGGESSGAASDFARARLAVIMRETFIPEIHDLARAQSTEWGENNNAIVDLEIANDWRERYAEVARNRGGADVAELFGNAAHVITDRLVDLSELAEELGELNGGWIPAARNVGQVGDRWHAIPWSYTAHAINYRQDVLDAAGVAPPDTYDDLLNIATVVREQQLPPAAFSMTIDAPNDSANFAYSLLWSFGGQEVDESGQRVALDSSATRDALAYFAELSAVSSPNAFVYDEGGNNDGFLSGEISLTQNATSIYWRALQERSAIAGEIKHRRYPAGPAARAQLLEINSLAVFSHSRSQDVAIDWIRANAQPEQLRRRTNISLAFFSPPFESYRDDPEMPWRSDPQLAGLEDVHIGGQMPGWPGPSSHESGLVYQNRTIVNMFASVGRGDASIAEAVTTATNELARVYET